MKKLRSRLILLAGAFAMLAFSSLASAQATRTWVSGVGDDANPCSRTAPCKTFAGAISKTAPGGEIDCLDPGGFGALTITKSITIDCDSGAGGVLVAGTNGIVIAAANTDVINLRNLTFQGLLGGGNANAGLDGIKVLSAKTVSLEDVVIQGFGTNGIEVAASASTSVIGRDVKINGSATGITVATTAGNAVVDFQNCQIAGNTTAVNGMAGSLISLKDSVVAVNTVGVIQNAGGSQINIMNTELSSNALAVQSVALSTIRLVGNVFAQNGTATNVNGGTIASDGTNTNAGNGVVGAVSALPAPIKF